MSIFLAMLAVAVAGASNHGGTGKAMQTQQHMIFETAIESSRDYDNPFLDVSIIVTFTSPSGESSKVEAFWDGERTWRVRFSPDEVGQWQWRTESSDPANIGLHRQSGQFQCVPYTGDNPIYRHGPVRISENGRYFTRADGNPFLWLADTAWSGIVHTKQEDWERYLAVRKENGFNAIQVAAGDWRGTNPEPTIGAYTMNDGMHINVNHFREADKRFEAISRHGYVTISVLLWGGGRNHPIDNVPEEYTTRLAHYIQARYGAYNVIWLLAGDGNYRGERSEIWKRIGNSLFGEGKRNLVTMHPGNLGWVLNEFTNESWFDFVGYQSGHGDAGNHLEWLVKGPPATDWRRDPPRPFVNLEPNYEAHRSYHKRIRHTPHNIRRSFFWSLLVSPVAGYTYGHTAIWPWKQEANPDDPEDLTWEQALNSEGAVSIRYAKAFLGVIPWWKLVPDQSMIVEQPGEEDPEKFVVAARSEDGDLAVFYMPMGDALKLNTGFLKRPSVARWFNPRTGDWQIAGEVNEETHTFTAPDENDWVLRITVDG